MGEFRAFSHCIALRYILYVVELFSRNSRFTLVAAAASVFFQHSSETVVVKSSSEKSLTQGGKGRKKIANSFCYLQVQ